MASHQPHRPQDLHAAMAKATELRAIHAALLQSQLNACSNVSSPAVSKLVSSPSLLRASSLAEDYPVFTPCYEEDPLPGYQSLCPDNRSSSQIWRKIDLDGESVNKYSTTTMSEQSIGSAVEHLSSRNSGMNRGFLKHPTPVANTLKSFSKRTGSSENKPVSAGKASTPAVVSKAAGGQKKMKNGTVTDLRQYQHQTNHLQEKHKGDILSWLFSKSRKKSKPVVSSNKIESENMSQLLKDWGVLSIEALKKEVHEANENRDAALAEVSEMRTSLGELQHKLVSLETYCEELNKALKQATRSKSIQGLDRPTSLKKFKSSNGGKNSPMPVSNEVMVEGFLQIISEARLSMKQFCKTLFHHIGESGDDLIEKLNLLLEPYQITVSAKLSRALLYHLEALMNQILYEDFENCVFQKNGCAKSLDPQKNRQDNFSAFVALRNLSWNDVLHKGTKYHSEDFSRFCDEKMSRIVSMLNWLKPWPEQLLQCFFVAAKCIWLLHLLAFSFDPHLMMLCVHDNHNFDPIYMDNVLVDNKHNSQAPLRVKIMVMPGFYVEDRVLRCRVLCRHQNVT